MEQKFKRLHLYLLIALLGHCMVCSSQSAHHYGFIQNKGQVMDQLFRPNPEVKYIFCGTGINTHLKQDGFSYEVFVVERPAELDVLLNSASWNSDRKKMRELDLQTKVRTHRIDVELTGCNKNVQLLPENPGTDYINYYTTTTVPAGALNVQHFGKVTYKNVYPFIDLVFKVTEGHSVKYDFIVHPGGNINDIQLCYKGADHISALNAKLLISTAIQPIEESIPYSYQYHADPSARETVQVSFKKAGENTFSFYTADHDPGKTLVIDPSPNVTWGTYYGSTAGDYGMGVVLDPSGNSIATGDARSTTNIATTGAFQTTYAGGGDVFIAKFDVNGVRQWATYYGGSGWDGGTSITSDAFGNSYVTAWITGNGVFSTPGAHQLNYGGGPWDALVAKFSPAGARIWSTYYGGSMDDEGWGITCDAQNNVIVTGNTESSNNISSVGAHQTAYGGGSDDAFIAKFDPNGVRLWGTYYGGTGTETDWYKSGITTDNNSNVILASWTNSTNTANVIATPGAYQTTLNGSNDVFLAKFSPAGVRQWATYYGGVSLDVAYGVVCDVTNNIVFVGRTMSTANIATSGSHQTTLSGSEDALIVKFDQAGNRIWGTYYGGPSAEQAYNIDNICSQLVVIGYTTSTSGIAYGSNLHQPTLGGGRDAFVTLFDQANGTVVWGTYFGGSGSETPYWDESTISSNNGGDFVIVGNTGSSNNIAYGTPHQSTLSGFNNMFVTRFTGSGTFTITSVQNNVSCFGGSNANVTVTPTGGTAPYTYSWTPSGQTTQTATGLSAGNYTVIVTDANGCTSQQTFAITQPAAVSASTSSTPAGCSVPSGTATASASGGTGPYSYNWNPSAQTTATATGLAPGNYSVTVTDANGCTTTATVTVSGPGNPTASAQAQVNVLCNGGNTGSATVSVTGGQGPYTYMWSNAQTTATATGLGAGSYTVTVTDANGCTAQQTFTITEPIALSSSSAQSNVTCNAGNNGSASVNATGGTGPYTYLWSNSQTASTTSNLSAGTYTVTVTDANGCTTQQTITITQPPSLTTVMSSTASGCTSSTGTASVTVTGGVGPYTYLWNNGQTNATATGLGAGTFTVTCTDANGCIITDVISVSAPASPTATIPAQINVSCNGGNDGNATVSATGGTSPYTFLWSNSQTGATVSNLGAGTYTVTVTDANGCTTSQTVTITEPAALSITATSSAASCTGANGSAGATASGGTPGYTYAWSNGQTSQNATGLTAGTYTVLVTDANGCTQTQTITVTSVNTLAVSASLTQTGCTGNTGTATASPSNGTAPYTYSWSDGQTAQTASGLAAGNYTVIVTDANGCTQVQTVSVTQAPPPTALATASSTQILSGENSLLSASGGITYSWSPSTGLSCTTCANPVSTPLQTTTYCVQVTDANGCTDNTCVTIEVEIPCVIETLETLLPNAFSPNGDAVNNQYCVPDNACVMSFVLKVYDRWGEKVFESRSLSECWDGTFRGKPLNTGVFAYYFNAVLKDGNDFNQKGNITLVR